MKLFHLSDLHIGKQLHRYSMNLEQRAILAQVVELAREEKPDVVMIAGDVYDSPVPSAEAVSVFDGFLRELCEIVPQITVLIIAGNHDSAKRLDFASSILAKNKVHIVGMPPTKPEERIPRVTCEDAYGAVDFYLLPFVKPAYVRNVFDEEITSYDMAVRKLLEREKVDTTRRNVLLSHQFYTASGAAPVTSESEVHFVGGIENVDIAPLAVFDYAALGHIHRAQKIGKPQYRYCGTPLQYSVGEAGETKSLTVVELAECGSEPVIREVPLVQNRQVRRLKGTLDEVLAQADERNCHDYVSIMLTDEVEAAYPKERLEEVYDHILEIRIDNARTRRMLDMTAPEEEVLDPYTMFGTFFAEMNGREMTPEEESMLQSVINGEEETHETD